MGDEAKELSNGELWWYILGWENVEVLRGFMNTNGLSKDQWEEKKHTLGGELLMGIHHSTIGIWWGFLIKYWIPTILTVVLLSEFREKSYNPYGGYPWGCLMVIVVALIAIFPQWMAQKVDDVDEKEAVPLAQVGSSKDNAEDTDAQTPDAMTGNNGTGTESEQFVD